MFALSAWSSQLSISTIWYCGRLGANCHKCTMPTIQVNYSSHSIGMFWAPTSRGQFMRTSTPTCQLGGSFSKTKQSYIGKNSHLSARSPSCDNNNLTLLIKLIYGFIPKMHWILLILSNATLSHTLLMSNVLTAASFLMSIRELQIWLPTDTISMKVIMFTWSPLFMRECLTKCSSMKHKRNIKLLNLSSSHLTLMKAELQIFNLWDTI